MLWTSFNDLLVNGLWVAYNDSGIIGYWNINGLGHPQPRHFFRAAGHGPSSGCPAITTSPKCVSSAWTTAPPASCDAIASGCQTFHEADARGNPTVITRQRFYDPTTRFWWTAHTNYPAGQGYYVEKFGALGYQATEPTRPLLVASYQQPILDPVSGKLKAMVLLMPDYGLLDSVLAPYANLDDAVVYLIEATNGELLATSNDQSVLNATTGTQLLAQNAANELISTSAKYIAPFRATANGQYRTSSGVTITVRDYTRAHGTLHYKIVLAAYTDAPAGGGSSDVPAMTGIISSNVVMLFTLGLLFMRGGSSKAPMASKDQQQNVELSVQKS